MVLATLHTYLMSLHAQVASKRYVDYVAMSISASLHKRVASNIEDHVDRCVHVHFPYQSSKMII